MGNNKAFIQPSNITALRAFHTVGYNRLSPIHFKWLLDRVVRVLNPEKNTMRVQAWLARLVGKRKTKNIWCGSFSQILGKLYPELHEKCLYWNICDVRRDSGANLLVVLTALWHHALLHLFQLDSALRAIRRGHLHHPHPLLHPYSAAHTAQLPVCPLCHDTATGG